MASPRPIRLPAADFDKKPLPFRTVRGLKALRVHGPYPPVEFRLVSSHRFSHPDAPEALLYLSFDLEICLMECFGDAIYGRPGSVVSRSAWMRKRVTRIQVFVSLRICDLTSVETRTALKVDLSALTHPDLDVPQAWGLAIQKHPDSVDGLFYHSRFTAKRCLVLFDRPGLATKLKSVKMGELVDLDPAHAFLDQYKVALV